MMKNEQMDAIGRILLRVANGSFLLAHGVLKLVYFPPAGAMGFFELFGLPGETAWLLIAVEIAFGTMLLIGWQTRIAALGGFVVLLGAIIPHSGNGFVFSNPGGGWEYPLFWALSLLATAMLEWGHDQHR